MKSFTSILFLFCSVLTFGQTELQVVKTTIQDEFKYKSGYTLHVTGEKADIEFFMTDDPKIKFEVTLVSKHPDLAQAKSDLKKHEFISDKIGKTIYLRNFISLERKEEKPESNLKTEYIIYIPKNCKVVLENKFCKTNMVGFTNEIKINSSLSNLVLTNHTGSLEIKEYLGKILLENCIGDYKIEAKRSEIKLKNIEGDYILDCKFGEIEVDALADKYKLTLKDKNSKVKFIDNETTNSQTSIK